MKPDAGWPGANPMTEELETVLRLVAEGKLNPEEASPIIDALTRAELATATDRDDDDSPRIASVDQCGEQINRRVERRVERAHERIERAHERAARGRERAEERLAAAGDRQARHARGRQLRIRVTERGRQVVNLRIPIGFVETALQFVPGLGGDQTQHIRNAVQAGAIGPILDVEEEDGSGVLISVE